jgi:Protein of unknown function (DUF3575)
MKKLLFLSLLICFSTRLFGQNKKGQFEFALPLHPWIALTSSYYAQLEYHNNETRSTTAVIGYQGTPFVISYFSKVDKLKGFRADIGQRWYLKGKKSKYVRAFAGVNLSAEYSKYKLKTGLKVPLDSLNTSGFSFGPELNAGIKFVILKRITIAPSLGLRYYVNTHNSKKITQNPLYWQYDDWDNGKLKWEDNRDTIDRYRKGLLPIPYLNIGLVLKL